MQPRTNTCSLEIRGNFLIAVREDLGAALPWDQRWPRGTGGSCSGLAACVTLELSTDFTLLSFCVPLKQPHNILQRRLMETNLSKLRSSRGSWSPKSDISAQTNKLNQTKLGSSRKVEDEEFIVVSCQVIFHSLLLYFFFPPNFIFDSLTRCSCFPCFLIRDVSLRHYFDKTLFSSRREKQSFSAAK